MADSGAVLELWRNAESRGEDYCLATLVGVEGSSYRRAGARMFVTESGRRAGTISGGCLEAEVARQIFWLTSQGPIVRQYSTAADEDGGGRFGFGCGGTLELMLERSTTAADVLTMLERAYRERVLVEATTVVSGELLGQHRFAPEEFAAGTRIFREHIAPRTGLFIFGAGDDAQPLVTLARSQDWYTEVHDGRSHLARAERFPQADGVFVSHQRQALPVMRSTDAAVVMTHSYEQDKNYLRALLETPAGYIGVLGPRNRTNRLLEEIGALHREGVEERLHAPVGLPLGERNPAAIALAIAAEITADTQARLARSAAPRQLEISA